MVDLEMSYLGELSRVGILEEEESKFKQEPRILVKENLEKANELGKIIVQ